MDISIVLDFGNFEVSQSLSSLVDRVNLPESSGIFNSLRHLFQSNGGLDPSAALMAGLTKEQFLQENKFVNWDYGFLRSSYAAEDDNRIGSLPYSILKVWKSESQIKLAVDDAKFKLVKGGAEWNEQARRGFDQLSSERSVFDKMDVNGDYRHAIRMSAFNYNNDEMLVQRALYTQQARSNLLADYQYKTQTEINHRRTLRDILLTRFPGNLPPLSTPYLANTVGVSVIVMFRDPDGNLRPLLQIRDPGSAAMANGGIHCTGSRAAIWPTADQKMTAQNFFDDEAYTCIEQDFNLTPANSNTSIYPIALVREHARMGKPQIFYYGITDQPLDEIVKFRLEKQREKETDTNLDKKYRTMTEGQFKDLLMKGLWQHDSPYTWTHEARAMLTLIYQEFKQNE